MRASSSSDSWTSKTSRFWDIVSTDVRHHARLLGAGRWQVIRDARLPAALLWVGTSARITFGFAIHAAIVAEFTGANSGLGYLTVLGQNSFDRTSSGRPRSPPW
jgi:ABC-type nitrate/sulfonate/bicarbonate transport system permease component